MNDGTDCTDCTTVGMCCWFKKNRPSQLSFHSFAYIGLYNAFKTHLNFKRAHFGSLLFKSPNSEYSTIQINNGKKECSCDDPIIRGWKLAACELDLHS